MFSAKKINGQKLYVLARKGKSIERPPQQVRVATEYLSYNYPFLDLKIACSKGTYIRSIANDIAKIIGIEGPSSYVRVSEIKKAAIQKLIDNVDSSQVLDYL